MPCWPRLSNWGWRIAVFPALVSVKLVKPPLLLEKQHRALFSGRGDEGPNVKGGKAVKDGRRGGHRLCTSAARKIGRRPRSSAGGLSLTAWGIRLPNQANASAPKATTLGRVRPSRQAGERGFSVRNGPSGAQPESTRSPQARRPNALDVEE